MSDAPALCHKLLADTGVAITPGVDFEFDEAIGKRRVRVSYCGAPADVERAMEKLVAVEYRRGRARKYLLSTGLDGAPFDGEGAVARNSRRRRRAPSWGRFFGLLGPCHSTARA